MRVRLELAGLTRSTDPILRFAQDDSACPRASLRYAAPLPALCPHVPLPSLKRGLFAQPRRRTLAASSCIVRAPRRWWQAERSGWRRWVPMRSPRSAAVAVLLSLAVPLTLSHTAQAQH